MSYILPPNPLYYFDKVLYMLKRFFNYIKQIDRALLYIFIAVMLLSLSSPAIKWLVQHGGEVGICQPNSISFCNVLFVGNLCAGLVALLTFGYKNVKKEWKSSQFFVKLFLLCSSLFAVLYPTFIFMALEKTTVTNVVLVSRFESVIYIWLVYLLFHFQLTKQQVIGYFIITFGIVILLVFNEKFMFNQGIFFAVLAAIAYAIGSLFNKLSLQHFSVGTFVFIRNILSAFLFFFIAIQQYGFHHFQDAFNGDLWIVMLIYATLIIVIGQFCWYTGLKNRPPSTLANLNMIMPFLTIFYAFLFLKEYPSIVHFIAMSIILLGMFITHYKPKVNANLCLPQAANDPLVT